MTLDSHGTGIDPTFNISIEGHARAPSAKEERQVIALGARHLLRIASLTNYAENLGPVPMRGKLRIQCLRRSMNLDFQSRQVIADRVGNCE